MSLPQPPKELIDYLPNGKIVCFDHHLRVCGICCVDFTFGESDEDESDEDESDEDESYEIDDQDGSQGFRAVDENEDEEEDDDDDGRVFVLAGSMARFTPQWDEQILGPANTFGIEKDYKKPPKPLPLSSILTYYCPTCQLTWLIGEEGEAAARSHPSHHTYSHIYAGTNRSLLVFTDGACSGNGASNARGGLGVFFGPGSKFNFSERLSESGVHTSQKAELAALARALQTIRFQVLQARHIMVTNAEGGHDPRAVSDVLRLRLIVVTDSSYIVESMCSHFSEWKENKGGVLVNKAGKAVENSKGFLRLESEVQRLSMVGVQVVYYLVSREENKEADILAKGSIV
ncbi:Ribonuclease H1 [Lachnellula subtilissima]|uniref:ribonuclease H n=1 Tax=Lachnellula subtilissima TaxID=602034 RepID=A0A8H8UAH4_9HELO|nr:Ribonuclease H1 [Lachnellula subtilissima]